MSSLDRRTPPKETLHGIVRPDWALVRLAMLLARKRAQGIGPRTRQGEDVSVMTAPVAPMAMSVNSRDVVLWLVGNLAWATLVWLVTALYRRVRKQSWLYWPTAAGVTLATIATTTGAILGGNFESGDPMLVRVVMGACLACLVLYALLEGLALLAGLILAESQDLRPVTEPVWIAGALAGQVLFLYIVAAVGRALLGVPH